jgi:hypothetical protein
MIDDFCPARGITPEGLREGMKRFYQQLENMQIDPYGDLTNKVEALHSAMAVGTDDERDPYVPYLANVDKNGPGFFQTYTFNYAKQSIVRFLDNQYPSAGGVDLLGGAPSEESGDGGVSFLFVLHIQPPDNESSLDTHGSLFLFIDSYLEVSSTLGAVIRLKDCVQNLNRKKNLYTRCQTKEPKADRTKWDGWNVSRHLKKKRFAWEKCQQEELSPRINNNVSIHLFIKMYMFIVSLHI